MLLNTSKGENSNLFAYFRFCAFARVSLNRLVILVLLELLVILVLLVCAKSFRKKNNEKFNTALITSCILSQSFSIITIFFNHYNLFQ